MRPPIQPGQRVMERLMREVLADHAPRARGAAHDTTPQASSPDAAAQTPATAALPAEGVGSR